MYSTEQVVFSGATLKRFSSSADAQRGFCSNCGTQLSFTASFLPGLVDISIGSLDDPTLIAPQMHYWHSTHLSWVEFSDGLPRHQALPPFGDEE
jgi:hypothetical protein